MQVKKLVSSLSPDSIQLIHGSVDQEIRGIAYDSRKVDSGYLFSAIPGVHSDGHLFINDAVSKGAGVVVHSAVLDHYHDNVTYIQVRNTRTALSQIAAGYYNHPSQELVTMGITGTDGKSTTVWFLYQLLEHLGCRTGFISTVHMKTQHTVVKNSLRQSTPEALEIQMLLKQMVTSGIKYSIVETTSHGLSEKTARLRDVGFDAAILTNITHEHLEFHKTFDQYRNDKGNLFRSLKAEGIGVVNADDPNHGYFADATENPIYTYSLVHQDADVYASNIETYDQHTSFSISGDNTVHNVLLPVPGVFNVQNLLAAALTIHTLLNVPIDAITPLFPKIRPVPGRLEKLVCGQPFRVYVDFAHTPHAFEKLLSFIRPRVTKKLIIVFGSAGERDKEKRPMQGAVASQYGDYVILTDEDPRGEDPEKILREIASGCTHLLEGETLRLIPDRRDAIKHGFSIAEMDDTVLLLGKGHEDSIQYAHESLEWNEFQEATSILTEMGYRR